MGGESLQLEGRSAHDRAWYDCEVRTRSGGVFLRFAGYDTEDEEPLTELGAVRFSSVPAEPHHCPDITPGTRITGFKRSATCDLWVDTEVVKKKGSPHEGGKCNCRYTIKWLDTDDAGEHAELRLADICLLDSRSLEQHPQYAQYEAALQKQAAATAAVTANPRRQQPPPRQPTRASEDAGSNSGDDLISDSNSDEEVAGGQGGARQQLRQKQKQQKDADEARQQQQQERERSQPREFVLQPPAGAIGPLCALCNLPTLLESDAAAAASVCEDVRREFAGLYGGRFVVHRRCAAFSTDPTLSYPGRHVTRQSNVPVAMNLSFQGGVGNALSQRCAQCSNGGATAKCCHPGCRKFFHLRCAKACKVDPDNWELKCPAHSVLGHLTTVAGPSFYPSRNPVARQAELDGMRSGKVKRTQRLQGLDRGVKRQARGGLEADEPRRSKRHTNSRIKYNEQFFVDGFSEGWQKSLRSIRRNTESGSDDENGDMEEEEEDGDESGIQYQDESGSDNDGDFVRGGARRNLGRRGKQARRPTPTRRTGRERTKVKSYAEEQEELELKLEAYREAERNQKTGYEETRCQICESKSRGNEMLLCDHCDRGFHMFCLSPPLAAAPMAFWFCPHCLPKQACETCGHAQPGGKRGKGKRAAAARDLHYCSTCGALCHTGCMQEQEEGKLRCVLCLEGLQDVEAILGCRTPPGREGLRDYYVKFKMKGYRRCRWVTEYAALRMAPSQLQRFTRDSRDAASVEPNVQEQWLQVERVVATRVNEASGVEECLVKWRGLEYDKATWEPRDELEGQEKEALQKYERRMALRVERDVRVEEAARKVEVAELKEQPAFVKQAGSLKDYQLEGVSWVLEKLRRGMSVILGDEMGLGKTIQTAAFLQVARERRLTTGPVAVVVPLSTFGSWERELAKWAPGLEVLSYSGHQEARALIRKYELGSEGDDMEAVRRKQTKLNPRFHVMLTTYDVVIRDVPVLRRFDWSAVVIDEGHSLKGQDSQRGKALRQLGAPWRLLLTGTPLQNNLRELLALLAFMADCKLDDIERKVKRMSDPNPPPLGELAGGAEEDQELLEAQAYIRKLHAYLEPRMLRRMKAICLKGQMPPKITRKVACRLTPLQLHLYTDVLAKDWAKVHSMVRNRLEKKSMNNILIRLRQTCNHPYLLPGQEPEEYKDPESAAVAEEGWRLMVAASGKLSLLQQMLPRLLAAEHRVLLFSQSVEMLNILEDFLHDFQDTSGLLPKAEEDPSGSGSGDGGAAVGGSEKTGASEDGRREEGEEGREGEEEGDGEEDFVRGRPGSVIRYFRLDGSTKVSQRQAMMDSFNSIDCKVRVFLISTRAGSLGINLQTANTVILYDPDFNPFVDAQAEGRAHRLGQEETVMVYQLYTANSVEERILSLAAKKRKLEELVTRHLGQERGVSDEDIKSSVLYGWGNLMRQAGDDGKGGADLALSDAELERLLDREHVFADDMASGADAAALLGEVRAGGAAAMRFDRTNSGQAKEDEEGDEKGGNGCGASVDAAMEAAMVRLIQERARKYEEEKAAKEELGRGRRARGAATNYNEAQARAQLREMLSEEEEDEEEEEGSPGKKGRRRQARSSDVEYNPLLSPALLKGSGENGQPTAADLRHSSDSGGSDSDSSENEVIAAVAAAPAPGQAAVQQQQGQQQGGVTAAAAAAAAAAAVALARQAASAQSTQHTAAAALAQRMAMAAAAFKQMPVVPVMPVVLVHAAARPLQPLPAGQPVAAQQPQQQQPHLQPQKAGALAAVQVQPPSQQQKSGALATVQVQPQQQKSGAVAMVQVQQQGQEKRKEKGEEGQKVANVQQQGQEKEKGGQKEKEKGEEKEGQKVVKVSAAMQRRRQEREERKEEREHKAKRRKAAPPAAGTAGNGTAGAAGNDTAGAAAENR